VRPAPLFALLPVAALVVSGCHKSKQIYVDGAYVRLSAVTGRPAVAYFNLHASGGGPALVSVTSPAAIRAELHETMMQGAMSAMAPVAQVPLPKTGPLVFAPGGKHVMLFDVNPVVKPGGTMVLRFTFADGSVLEQPAKVVGPADPAPQP